MITIFLAYCMYTIFNLNVSFWITTAVAVVNTPKQCLECVQIVSGSQKVKSSSPAWGDAEVVHLLLLTVSHWVLCRLIDERVHRGYVIATCRYILFPYLVILFHSIEHHNMPEQYRILNKQNRHNDLQSYCTLLGCMSCGTIMMPF